MVTVRDPRVSIAPAYQAMKRVTRAPRYPFQLRYRPYQLQPFMCAPVLPGETLDNAVLQARIVTDPVVAPLVGWWVEHWYFYVKHRDLAGRDDFAAMMINPSQDMSAYVMAADPKYFHAGGIGWLQLCYQRIVEEYFRDEGENWNVSVLDGLGMAQIVGNNVLDSLTNAASFVDRDVPVDLDGDTKVEASELDQAYSQWMAMRDAGLMDMDYEDFLRTYGVNTEKLELGKQEESVNIHRPELLRHNRAWSYPTNTIDPSDGTPRSAVSWSVAESINKRRYFAEPGFIVGIVCARPKVYLNAQTGSFAPFMNNQLRWLPAVINDHPELSYMQFADNTGPLAVLSDTGGYWVDTRDLLTHGEQFVNFALDDAASRVSLPDAVGGRRYPAAADINKLFVDATAGVKVLVKEDGVTFLSIKGRQRDHSPGKTL